MLALFLLGTPGWAEVVTLRHASGFAVTGEVMGFDGRFVRISSETGALTLDLMVLECDGAGCPDPEAYVPSLRIAGAPRMAEVLLPALIESFARQDGQPLDTDGRRFALGDAEAPALVVELIPSSTGEGFADVLSGGADAVMAMREITDIERALLLEAGAGDLTAEGRSRIVGVTALVPVVASGNPAQAISSANLARAVSGRELRWTTLGGGDTPVRLHLGSPDSGLVEGLAARYAGQRGLGRDIVHHAGDGDLVAAVGSDPEALGLVALDRAVGVKVLRIAGACGLGMSASPDTLRTEDFPLTAPLILYLPQWRLPDTAARFLAWLDTPQAQAVVRRSGFVDLAPVEIPLDAQGERLANAIRQAGADVSLGELQAMLRQLEGTVRLSSTFRFEAGSTRLDAASRANLRRLALALEQGDFAGRRMVLAGFTDGRGPAEENRALSAARADVLKARLEALLPEGTGPRFETAGFGEALPMVCDDTAMGRQVNRRVEIWVGGAPSAGAATQ